MLLATFFAACVTSNADIASIPVDQAGFAERLRRACELGSRASIEEACGSSTLAPALEESDAEDEDAWDGGDDSDGALPSD